MQLSQDQWLEVLRSALDAYTEAAEEAGDDDGVGFAPRFVVHLQKRGLLSEQQAEDSLSAMMEE